MAYANGSFGLISEQALMVQAHIQAAGHLLPTSQTKELGCVCLQALQDTNPLW